MKSNDRVYINSNSKFDYLLDDKFLNLITNLHDKFSERVYGVREERLNSINNASKSQTTFVKSENNIPSQWKINNIPDELKIPGIEISGPAHITPMFINAINPGPDGERAIGYLDDDEDSASHRLNDTLNAAENRKKAVDRSLNYYDQSKHKNYEISNGTLPFFMHRERGLHLEEKDVLIDGIPISATLFSTALTL